MRHSAPELTPADWSRIRSFAVTPERQQLPWEEMDHCLALADRLTGCVSPEP
ncbi:MAG: hypothetical protein ACK6BG_06585 [Cyanobacteriota bacterium]